MSTIATHTDETFSVRLPRTVATEVRHIAESEGNGASAVIRRLLALALRAERGSDFKLAIGDPQ